MLPPTMAAAALRRPQRRQVKGERLAQGLMELTDEMKAAVGSTGPPSTSEVTTTDIRLFARAVGYRSPIYYDEEEAKQQGHRALPAPPGYYGRAVPNPTRDRAAAQPRAGQVQSPFKRNLNGGSEVEPLRQVYAGDVLTSVTTLIDLQIVPSRAYGQMMIRTSETVITNQDGEVVARTRGTGISY